VALAGVLALGLSLGSVGHPAAQAVDMAYHQAIRDYIPKSILD
jgi:hypothetical protein